MKTAAIYVRVSTADQHVESQLYDLRQLAADRGFEVVQEYQDWGVSGKRRGVRAWISSWRMHGGRNSRVVLVAAFDRVARSVKHFLQVMDEFDSLGIGFISRRENIDTSGPMGRLFLTLIGSIAELESDLIRERVLAGMRRAKLDGVRIGRAPMNIRSGSHRPRPIQWHDSDGCVQEMGDFPQSSLQTGKEITVLVTKAPCCRQPEVVDAVDVMHRVQPRRVGDELIPW